MMASDATAENPAHGSLDFSCSSLLSALPNSSSPVGSSSSPHVFTATNSPDESGTDDTSELRESLRVAREEVQTLRSMVSSITSMVLAFNSSSRL